MDAVASEASEQGVKLIAKRKKLLQTSLAFRDEAAEPVIKRVHKLGNREPDPIRGLVEAKVNDQCVVVEYEPDSELRDTEQVPLLDEGGIEGFLRPRSICPMLLMHGTFRRALKSATRSALLAISTSHSRCGHEKKSALIF